MDTNISQDTVTDELDPQLDSQLDPDVEELWEYAKNRQRLHQQLVEGNPRIQGTIRNTFNSYHREITKYGKSDTSKNVLQSMVFNVCMVAAGGRLSTLLEFNSVLDEEYQAVEPIFDEICIQLGLIIMGESLHERTGRVFVVQNNNLDAINLVNEVQKIEDSDHVIGLILDFSCPGQLYTNEGETVIFLYSGSSNDEPVNFYTEICISVGSEDFLDKLKSFQKAAAILNCVIDMRIERFKRNTIDVIEYLETGGVSEVQYADLFGVAQDVGIPEWLVEGIANSSHEDSSPTGRGGAAFVKTYLFLYHLGNLFVESMRERESTTRMTVEEAEQMDVDMDQLARLIMTTTAPEPIFNFINQNFPGIPQETVRELYNSQFARSITRVPES